MEAYRKKYGRPALRFENLFNVLGLLPELEFDRVRIDPDSARTEGAGAPIVVATAKLVERLARLHVVAGARPHRRQGRRAQLGCKARDQWRFGVGERTVVRDLVADSWHSGWPTTTLALVNGDAGPRVVIGGRNARRLGDYHLLDLRIQRTFQLSRGELDVFFEASNLTSRESLHGV